LKSDSKPPVHIKLLDVEYSVYGYDDPEYLHEVAGLVDRRMRALSQMYNDVSHLRNAILAALNLADELIRTRRQLEQYQAEASDFNQQVADRSQKLIELCARNQ
jgi:cell division protein ZapA